MKTAKSEAKRAKLRNVNELCVRLLANVFD